METKKSYCTNCGAEMDPNAAFCVKCGVSKGKIKHFCNQCGAKVTPEQDFCTTCGNKLSNKLDMSKGKETFDKLTKAAVSGTNNLATAASKKTGKKIKPAWLVGAAALVVVVIVAIFMLRPKGISGDYASKTTIFGVTSSDTLVFDGKKVSEKDTDNKGTYEISGDTLKMKFGDYTITAKLAKDHQSFTITNASGVAGLLAGKKYTKGAAN